MLKTVNKVTYNCPAINDVAGWMRPNLFINTQMMISTDMDGNFCMESFRFVMES